MRYLRSKAGNTHLLLPASYCKYLQTPLYLILSDISFTVQFIWWQGQSVRDLFPPASARPPTNFYRFPLFFPSSRFLSHHGQWGKSTSAAQV